MFSFFKKKPPAPVAPPLENEEVASTPAPSPAQDTPVQDTPVQDTPSLSEPTLSAQDALTASAEPAATESAPLQEPVTPEATAEAANAPKHSWTERLKAGLGIHSAATLPETPAIEPATPQAPALEAELTHAATEPDAIPAPESAPLHTPTIEVPAENAAPAADTQPIAASPAPSAPPPEAPPTPKSSWTERLKAGLAKTRSKLGKSLAALFGGGKIDEDLYEELEAVLLTADMGIAATTHLLGDVRQRVSLKGLKDASELKGALKDSINELIEPLEKPLDISGKKPFVIMLAGVNGAGKTTSIGKLAKYYQDQGKSVLLAAGDTFRAAAREQLMAWGERNNVTVIAQQGGDSAAVCYDAIQAAMARGIDVVLADTAGRLPTQLHLMEEIKKVKRVIQKALPEAPHEIILVLDANIGQNAVSQVVSFDDALQLTGLILTKLDGTAKGGVIAAIASQRPIPLRFIGVGEGIDDLRPFKARDYVDALFD